MKVLNKTRFPSLLSASQNQTMGPLVIPIDQDDGETLLPLGDNTKFYFGHHYLRDRFGMLVRDANILIETYSDVDQEGKLSKTLENRFFLNGDIRKLKAMIQAATQGYLADCTGFTHFVDTKNTTLAAHDKGDYVESKGFYIGPWEPYDMNERSLGHIFDVFAAPEDILDSNGKTSFLTFEEALLRMKTLQHSPYHGHSISDLTTASDIYNAIAKGESEVLEGWFIPPIDLLGKNREQQDRLMPQSHLEQFYKHPVIGDSFQGELSKMRTDHHHRYLSSTPIDDTSAGHTHYVMSIKHDGSPKTSQCDKNQHPVRLVRAELRR